MPYAKSGGYCLFMKGDNVDEEINTAQNALKTLNCKIETKHIYNFRI